MKVIGIIGWKNSGKTFFATQIINKLSKKGLRVASIKRAHHAFEIDKPNTDSYLHRKAGSEQVIVSSAKRWVKISEVNNQKEKTLNELLDELIAVDIVIVEGFKNENHPKIEIIHQTDKNYLFKKNTNVIALISDNRIDANIQQFKKNEINVIVDFIINYNE
tara:strand:+ start:4086 stop:4571 length:486 start_codon:yes stop_codon:yes gene_type:complete